MLEQRRRFSPQFKAEAVQMVLGTGKEHELTRMKAISSQCRPPLFVLLGHL